MRAFTSFSPLTILSLKAGFYLVIVVIKTFWMGVVKHACNPSTGEAEVGEWPRIQGQPVPHSRFQISQRIYDCWIAPLLKRNNYFTKMWERWVCIKHSGSSPSGDFGLCLGHHSVSSWHQLGGKGHIAFTQSEWPKVSKMTYYLTLLLWLCQDGFQ